MTGILVLGIALLAAVGLGLYRRTTDGRVSTVSRQKLTADAGAPTAPETGVSADARNVGAQVLATRPDAGLGERATFVQFSSSFCAPCRTTRVLLGDVAATEAGVVHLEVDAEQHLDLVRALDVRRTPTTLILDADGNELGRAAGAPKRDQVLAALPAPLGATARRSV